MQINLKCAKYAKIAHLHILAIPTNDDEWTLPVGVGEVGAEKEERTFSWGIHHFSL